MIHLADTVEEKFKELYNEQPLLLRSPGRVNLIGEHTDYNHGFVLPGAIDKAVYFAIAPRTDERCELFALDVEESHRFALTDLSPSPKRWPNYLIGVVDQLLRAGCPLRGFNCVFGGDIPIGAGLSSSAAIEAGLAFALDHLFDLNLDRLTLVRLAQKAENEFVGVQCGIMDQFINVFGRKAHVLRIDCRSLEHEYYPFDHDVAVVLFNSGVSHSLASTEYNRRRAECAEGVTLLKRFSPHITHLRDVSPDMLASHKDALPPIISRRCTYVVEENARVIAACGALERADLEAFGRLMNETHDGLSSDYEVSCEELDFLVELARSADGVLGARMMGGGFGGCTINLMPKDAVGETSAMVKERYAKKFGREPETYITSISAGTTILQAKADAKV